VVDAPVVVDPPVVIDPPAPGRTRRVAMRKWLPETTLTAADVDPFVDALRDRLKSLVAEGPLKLTIDEEDR
jgi:hypothetical protein